MKSNFIQRALTVFISVAIVGGVGSPASATGPTTSQLFASLSYDAVSDSYEAVLNIYVPLTQVPGTPSTGQFGISSLTFQGVPNAFSAIVFQAPPPASNATPVTLQGSAGSHPLIQNFNASALSSRTEALLRVCFGVRYESATEYQVCSASIANNGAGSGLNSNTASTTPAPTKYEGPEFLGLVNKGVLAGSSHQLEGKNLDKVTSIEVDGKVAKFEALSKTELKFDVPEGLAPGVYDLVINYSGGKLTHLRGLEVKEVATPTKFSTVTKGLDTEPAFKEHREYAASQDSKLNKARCIVNAPSLATAQIRAERLCKLIGFSNENIKSFIIEPKSTVTGNSIYARVHYGADY